MSLPTDINPMMMGDSSKRARECQMENEGFHESPRSFNGYHFKIGIHLGEDGGSPCSTDLCFESDRYYKHIHCSPDWNWEDSSCLEGYIFPEQLSICQEHSKESRKERVKE